jgi:hypothetical protein
MALQALSYQREYPRADFGEFIATSLNYYAEQGLDRSFPELYELLRIKPNFSPLNFSHTDIRDLVDSLRQHNFASSQITIRETNVSNLSEKINAILMWYL